MNDPILEQLLRYWYKDLYDFAFELTATTGILESNLLCCSHFLTQISYSVSLICR